MNKGSTCRSGSPPPPCIDGPDSPAQACIRLGSRVLRWTSISAGPGTGLECQRRREEEPAERRGDRRAPFSRPYSAPANGQPGRTGNAGRRYFVDQMTSASPFRTEPIGRLLFLLFAAGVGRVKLFGPGEGRKAFGTAPNRIMLPPTKAFLVERDMMSTPRTKPESAGC